MKNIGIICGGFSSEFDISVKSASTILSNFPAGYRPFLVVLSRDGFSVRIEGEVVDLNRVDFSFVYKGQREKVDAAIIYIHGDPGENGKIQAYLEIIGIPYVNSGPLASQLSFDKWYCNQFLRAFDIPVAKSIHLTNSAATLNAAEIIERLGLPVFVKPCDSGSSYGIAKISSADQLLPGIENAFKEGRSVVVEAFLDGTEVTCGVYRTAEGVHALPITEIVSDNDFFDYEAKYLGKSQEITPARVSQEVTALVQNQAKNIYELLQLRSIARIDFMVVNNVPHVIEVNTTPGFSNESIVPKMLGVAGISITDFWASILKEELK